MWDLIVSVPDHCLSFYIKKESLLAGNCLLTNVPVCESFALHTTS